MSNTHRFCLILRCDGKIIHRSTYADMGSLRHACRWLTVGSPHIDVTVVSLS